MNHSQSFLNSTTLVEYFLPRSTPVRLDAKDRLKLADFSRRAFSSALVGCANVMVAAWLARELKLTAPKKLLVPISLLSMSYFSLTCHKISKDATSYLQEKNSRTR